ncbi:MAG: cobalamin biosynthesis protein, partial [Candidatus Omnitrophica bacterium]|nr:cobalamin biosynthesis protein [Candidatus Omnitrophota bacterium]
MVTFDLPMKLVLAFFLDLVAGDPENWLHPVRAIGWLIEKGEAILRRLFPGHLRLAGILLTFFICAISYLITLV